MIDRTSLRRAPKLVGALQRPSYEAGSYLAAHDLLAEQRYRLQRLRHHTRYLHGWGVSVACWLCRRPTLKAVGGTSLSGLYQLFLQVSDKNKAILFRGEEAHVVTAGRIVYREIILGEQRQEPCPPPPESETVRVPDLIGRMEAEVIEAIQSAGLTVGQRQTQPAPNQVGWVLAQDPKAGTEVPVGTAVNLVIGSAEQVKVPKLVSIKLQSAREKIKESGLKLGSVTKRESPDVDVVLEQDPEAEKEVPIGTAVNLVVGQQRVEG
jgi:hypothetical protein